MLHIKLTKKICLIKNGYFDDVRIIRDAYTLLQAGFRVDVICLRKKNEKLFEIVDGIKIFHIPIIHRRRGIILYFLEYSTFFIFSFFLITFLFLKRKYNIVQAINFPDFLVFTALIPKLLGTKVVLAMPEPSPELLITMHNNSFILKKVMNFLQIASCNFADLILPVTNSMKEYLVKKGIPKRKLEVILNVPHDSLFREGNEINIQNDQGNQLNLVYAGTIIQRFGIETMIEAISLLYNEIPQIKLDIYGSGEFMLYAKELIKRLNLNEKIIMHGYVNLERIPKILEKSDICLVPILRNRYSELIHTHKMFEAVAIKRPVIASRISSFFECFDESCICYFESGDAHDLSEKIKYLFFNKSKRIELVENAYLRYAAYKWVNHQNIYIELINKLNRNHY